MFGLMGQFAGSGARLAGAGSDEALGVSSFIGRQRISPFRRQTPEQVEEFQQRLAAQRAAAAGTPELTQQFLDELRGIRQNTSQAPVITGAALQSPVAAAAAP